MTKILLATAIACAMVVALVQLEASDDFTLGTNNAVGATNDPANTTAGGDVTSGDRLDDTATSDAEETTDLTLAAPGEAPPSGDRAATEGDVSGPVLVQSNDSTEIAIDPNIPIAADDAETAMSSEGARVCASIETAIEAVRTSDWPTFDELIYEVTPLATAAEEVAISQLSTQLFALTTDPDPAPALNRMINVCVAEGHQL